MRFTSEIECRRRFNSIRTHSDGCRANLLFPSCYRYGRAEGLATLMCSYFAHAAFAFSEGEGDRVGAAGPAAEKYRDGQKKVVLGCVFPPLYAGARSRNLGKTCFILFKNSLDKRPFGAS